MRIKKGYWIWGLFPYKETKILNQIKSKVQRKLKSPFFVTHITLAGPYLNIDEIFKKKIKTFAEFNSPIILNIEGYDFKQEPFESFYISINNSRHLNNLRKKIYELKKFDFKNNYSPHISLAYGDYEIKLKKQLISKLPELCKSIKMSKISLVEVDENINSWKLLEIFDFK